MRPEKLSADKLRTLEKRYDLDRRLATIRDFSTRLYKISQARSAQAARNRRTWMLGMDHLRREQLLKKALERLADGDVPVAVDNRLPLARASQSVLASNYALKASDSALLALNCFRYAVIISNQARAPQPNATFIPDLCEPRTVGGGWN